jgi:hypothetical protein
MLVRFRRKARGQSVVSRDGALRRRERSSPRLVHRVPAIDMMVASPLPSFTRRLYRGAGLTAWQSWHTTLILLASLAWANGRVLHPAGRLRSSTLSYCYLMSGAGLAPRCARGARLGNATGSRRVMSGGGSARQRFVGSSATGPWSPRRRTQRPQ